MALAYSVTVGQKWRVKRIFPVGGSEKESVPRFLLGETDSPSSEQHFIAPGLGQPWHGIDISVARVRRWPAYPTVVLIFIIVV